MHNTIVSVTNLTKTFYTKHWFWQTPTAFTAVNNISFNLEENQILGFLGLNGAGKTTTINMLIGTMTPTTGSITYFGQDLTRHRSDIIHRVTHTSGFTKLIGKLTVKENLIMYGYLYDMKKAAIEQRIRYLAQQFALDEILHKRAGELSTGQTTRALIARVFIPSPQVILLDEPTAALDPKMAHDVRRFIVTQQRQEGLSILLTSHNMDEVAELCDHVLVLEKGTIIASDTPKKLAATIATARIHLVMRNGMELVVAYAQQHSIAHQITGASIQLDVAEHAIAQLLQDLAQQNVIYSNISIEEPSLEDYFLSMAKRGTLS
jgi:ABC-2 type transport system ATP-binding protein